MLKTVLENVVYPIEHLVFQLSDPASMDEFIALDLEIWTTRLAAYDGFISKEVWINTNNPGEVHNVIIWEKMDKWKSIPIEDLKKIAEDFDRAYGKKYMTTRRIHKENNHGIHLVSMVSKKSE